MATTAGVLEILIKTKDETSSGLSAAESKVKSFTGSMSSWAVAKGQLISSFVKQAGKAVVNLAKDATQTSMGFDKAMSQYIATRGATLEDLKDESSDYYKEMQKMTKFAREMGLQGKYSATQVAEALNYMALAGYSAETSMEMMPQVLALAAAGDMDLARASDIVTDAQTAFGLSIDETKVMVDQMAKTASLTNTSVEQLGEAFLTVGANARSIVQSGTDAELAELSAILGQLASNGIKGAKGGTVLRNILNALSNPAGKAAKQLKALGVNAYDATTHELKPMTEILVDIKEALSGKEMDEQAEFFAKAFNVRDTAAVKALLDVDASGWTDLMLKIVASNNAAQDMADVQLDNLNGDVAKLNNALEDAKLEIMKGITPQLQKLVRRGTTWVKRLTTAFSKDGFAGAVKEARDILNETIKSLKESDSPILQAIGSGLETIKKVGKEVYGLISDFPGKLKEWKESDSAGLRALSDVFSALSDAADVLVAAFNGGLPGAIDKLHEIGTPISETAAAGLEVFKSVCETVAGNSDIGGIIETIAKGFLLLKGVEITGSLLMFITKLTTLGSLKNLGQLANMFKNGNIPGLGNQPTGTNPPVTTGTNPPVTTGTTPPVTNAAPVAASTGSNVLPAIGAGAWTVGWIAFGAAMVDAWNREGEVLKQMREKGEKELKEAQEFTENVASKSENTDLYEAYDWLTKFTTQGYEGAHGATNTEKIKQIAEEWNDPDNWSKSMEALADVMDNDLYNAFDEAMQLVSSGEAEADYSGESAKFISDTIDALHEAVKAKLEEEAMQQEVRLEPDDSEIQSTLANGYSTTVKLTPVSSFLGFGQAKGDWNVPYDNYPSLLHRGEMVLTASQARRYRDGDTGGSSEIVSAIQSLKNEMANMKIMVGQKVFGRTVVDYGGRRMSNYIGNAESKLAAGYGT